MRSARALRMRIFFGALLLAGLAFGPSLRNAAAQEQSKPQTEKKDKKADKSKSDAQATTGNEPMDVNKERKNLSRQLRAFQDGFEGKSVRRTLELIDSNTFYDYPHFKDQVTKFLEDSSEMRIYFRESTSEVKGDKATLIVDADMTYSLKTNAAAEQKRHERIQFDFVKTPKGWKIYEISPRRFFIP